VLSWLELKSHKAKLDAQKAARESEIKREDDAEVWKDKFFGRHPDADTDGDGLLSWPEYHAYKLKLDARNRPASKKGSDNVHSH